MHIFESKKKKFSRPSLRNAAVCIGTRVQFIRCNVVFNGSYRTAARRRASTTRYGSDYKRIRSLYSDIYILHRDRR